MEELLKQCGKLFAQKDFSALELVSNEILEIDENNEAALTYKLYVYCYMRQFHLVFGVADKIHRLYPQNIHAHNCEAIAYMERKEFEKALECCDKALKINDCNDLKKNKVEALISLDRTGEAYEFFKVSDIPDYTFTNALINCGKYCEIYDYEDISDRQIVDCLLKRCEWLERKSDYGEILRVCDEIFKIDTGNEAALENKIYALQGLERDDEALKFADYAIGLYPESYMFHFLKADSLLWVFEDIDGAIECIERGLSIAGNLDGQRHCIDNLLTALFKKADKLAGSGSFKKAAETYDRVLFYRSCEFKALDSIDALVRDYETEYEPTQHYRKSLKLKTELEDRSNRIDEYLNDIDVGSYDANYVNGCSEFRDYESLADYIRDIIISLMDAYPGFDEQYSKYRVKIAFENVKKSFEFKEPAYDFAVVCGFGCG